jgi:hypothetical protein
MDDHHHLNASRDAFTLPAKALHCNAHASEAEAHEPPRLAREAWKHPMGLAAMISAVASLAMALALFVK